VVPQHAPYPSISELRQFLKKKLPDYMIPSAFVMLEALPRTSHGKLDLQALPPPDMKRPELESVFVAPRTPVEETIAGIWAEILGREHVGVHDNFFELGGHSLLATQVISRIRRAFQMELSLRSIFEAPTIAELSGEIEKTRDKGLGSRTAAISPISRESHRMKVSWQGRLMGPKGSKHEH
jgi:acyl carrier protein